MSDDDLRDAILRAVSTVTRLMNEAKDRGIAVEFQIPETEMMGKNEAGDLVCLRKVFREIVQINGTIVAA